MTTTHINRLRCSISNTPGTSGNVVVGAATSAARRTFTAAEDGKSFEPTFEDGNNWEVRAGCVYTHSTATLTRGTLVDSSTGSAIALTSAAIVGLHGTAAAMTDLENARGLNSTEGVMLQRPAAKSLNAVAWRHIVNQNPYTDNSGPGGVNYNNEVVAQGWNLSNDVGTPATAGTAAVWDNWEYKYCIGGTGGKYYHERHMENVDTSGVKHRFFSFAVPHDGGTGSSHMLSVDTIAWYKYDQTTVPVQWNISTGTATLGSSTTGYRLNFDKNNAAPIYQRNAANSAYIALPYLNASDQLVMSGQILHSATSPTTGNIGISCSFSGAPGDGSTGVAIDIPATTNATLYALKFTSGTNWEFDTSLRNTNTSQYAAAINIVESDGATGWAFSKYRRSNGNDSWTVGKNHNGNFFIAGTSPLVNPVLTIDKTSFLTTYTAPLQLMASTTATAMLKLQVGSAPTTPADGDVWLESNTNTGLKIRVNGVTKTVSLV